jgi:ferredoxin
MERVEDIDLTPLGTEDVRHDLKRDELTIIAAPVYGGRIPSTAIERLKNLRTDGTPAVLVVVYGNRAYEDALLELKDLATGLGFKAVAGAAFIGEHSYSTPETPIATGRPDEADLEKAKVLGAKVKAKLDRLTSIPRLVVPGNRPYKERRVGEPRSPETEPDTCILCGTCARICPTGVVTVSEAVKTEKEGCISCTACVKNCPTGARHWGEEGVKKMAEWLHTNYSARKEPEFFI